MNKFTNIKERIRYIADYKKVKKETFFGQLGMTSANFRGDKINRPINSNAIEKIITLYPDINPTWLIAGKGEMLLNNVAGVNESNAEYAINSIKRTIPHILISALPSLGRASLLKDKDVINRYMIPDFSNKGVQFIIEVTENERMQPKYFSGDLLGCKHITDTSFIQWGKSYVLDTEQGVIIARLFPIDEATKSIECRFYNEKNYPSFIIDISSINSFSLIGGVLRME